jgi:hypothetical protein
MRLFKHGLAVIAGLALTAILGTVLTSRQAIADNNKVSSVAIAGPFPLPVNATLVGSVPLTAFTIPLAPSEPFQQQVYVTIDDTTTGSLRSFNVPDGKRLVIEHVGGMVYLDAGQFARAIEVRTDYGASFGLVANKVSDQPDDVYVINSPMKLYADQIVEFKISRAPASAGSSLSVFSVSGYLVNR